MNIPRVKHNKGKAEGCKLKIHETPDTLNAPNAPTDRTLPIGSRGTATTSISESGASLAPPPPILYRALIIPTLQTSTFQPMDVWPDVCSLCMNSPPWWK